MLQLIEMNIQLATIIHPTTIISPYAIISLGCTVLVYSVVNINACIGNGLYCKYKSNH